MRYAVGLVGPEHVALSSDFDGKVQAPFDAAGMALLTEALLEDSFAEEEIEQIMSRNVVGLLQRVLPN